MSSVLPSFFTNYYLQLQRSLTIYASIYFFRTNSVIIFSSSKDKNMHPHWNIKECWQIFFLLSMFSFNFIETTIAILESVQSGERFKMIMWRKDAPLG